MYYSIVYSLIVNRMINVARWPLTVLPFYCSTVNCHHVMCSGTHPIP